MSRASANFMARRYRMQGDGGNVLALTPYVVDQFHGLDLRPSTLAVGGSTAVDALDVDFDVPGSVRKRDGYQTMKALTATSVEGLAVIETSSGTKQFVAGYTNGATKKYEAYASTGGAAVASATPAATAISAARIGTPTAEYLYIANGVDTVWRWTGAAFSQPAGMPAATHLTAKSNSNRLVAANITGTSISRVQFSDAGAPETWTSTSFVDVAPGDGSEITGLATWQNDVYAFKRNRFFVFGVESTDSTGKPVFNYRAVDGYGATVPPVAGTEGVYFFDGRYVWLTAGGPPKCISNPLDALFSFRVAITAGTYGGQTRPTETRLSYSKGRLYLSIPIVAGTSYATLVYDPRIDAWTAYSTTLRYAADLDGFAYWLSSDGKVNRFQWDSPTDSGAAVNWLYQSGCYDMGVPGQVKVVREVKVWGVGDVSFRVISDDTADTGSTLTLTAGGSNTPSKAGAWQQVDREATFFAHYLSATSSAAAGVHRIVYYLESLKPAGVQ